MAGKKKPLRWGLIGCGDVVRKRVAQAIIDDPNSTLVGACRRDETKLNQFCDHFDIKHRFTNTEQFLRLEEIDAVYIAFNRFKNAADQKPEIHKLLPIEHAVVCSSRNVPFEKRHRVPPYDIELPLASTQEPSGARVVEPVVEGEVAGTLDLHEILRSRHVSIYLVCQFCHRCVPSPLPFLSLSEKQHRRYLH